LILVLHLQRKRDYLEQLAERIEALRFESDPTKIKEVLAGLPRDIKQQVRGFDRLSAIEQNVSSVTSKLTRKLAKDYPSLTRTELVVCTYLCAGLTPGQAAEIMYVSRRAVEKHRQSIRTKVGLESDDDISTWLSEYEKAIAAEK
jgi:DNA-binding CsgD family transcriptional regulator